MTGRDRTAAPTPLGEGTDYTRGWADGYNKAVLDMLALRESRRAVVEQAPGDASAPPHPRVCPNGLDCPCYDKPWTAADASSRTCPDCHGTGDLGSYYAPVPCGRCEASGEIEVTADARSQTHG